MASTLKQILMFVIVSGVLENQLTLAKVHKTWGFVFPSLWKAVSVGLVSWPSTPAEGTATL
jgi:hypothetical protein